MAGEIEGVIKYKPNYVKRYLPPELVISLEGLNRWRRKFYDEKIEPDENGTLYGLVGQNPDNYGGYGYGNLSQRVRSKYGKFVITATQTGGLEKLDPNEHFAVVSGYNFKENMLRSYGPSSASSEGLTHAIPYEEEPNIMAVFHAHNIRAWQAAEQLGIPTTPIGVEYGTPEMAEETRRLFYETDVIKQGVYSMGGHEGGIVSIGGSLDEAGLRMLDFVREAILLSPKTRFDLTEPRAGTQV